MVIQAEQICMAIKTINGKHCTIIYVDDLKLWQVDKKVKEDFIKQLNEKFRKESPFTTAQGKVPGHDAK